MRICGVFSLVQSDAGEGSRVASPYLHSGVLSNIHFKEKVSCRWDSSRQNMELLLKKIVVRPFKKLIRKYQIALDLAEGDAAEKVDGIAPLLKEVFLQCGDLYTCSLMT